MKLFEAIEAWIGTLAKFFSKALYVESPIHDDEGNVIGREWFGIRGGRVETEYDESLTAVVATIQKTKSDKSNSH